MAVIRVKVPFSLMVSRVGVAPSVLVEEPVLSAAEEAVEVEEAVEAAPEEAVDEAPPPQAVRLRVRMDASANAINFFILCFLLDEAAPSKPLSCVRWTHYS